MFLTMSRIEVRQEKNQAAKNLQIDNRSCINEAESADSASL